MILSATDIGNILVYLIERTLKLLLCTFIHLLKLLGFIIHSKITPKTI